MIHRLLDHGEQLIKGVLFGCQGCGQCVLRANAMVCPMTCPKGLRNGPCGGTLGGRCEVHPERACVHVRIHARRHRGRAEAAPIMPAIDYALCRSASLVNAATGADRGCRDPLPAISQEADAVARPMQTASRLEAALKSGRFVLTTEVRAPRGASLERVRREAEVLRGRFDAVNATAYLAGNPSLPSSVVAAELARLGIEPIAQVTGRDATRTTFTGELFAQQAAGVHNLLCLTGDWRVGTPMVKPVYELDSSLMLYHARHLRERARILHTGEEVGDRPRPFLGAAINPLSDPIDVPLRRLRQKADAGADFVQTQVLTEPTRLVAFMHGVRAQGLHRRLFILAGIPVVTSRKALEHLDRIAGVSVDPAFRARLAGAADIRAEGVAIANEMLRSCQAIPGIAGAHLMLFGADHTALVDVAASLQSKETPCLSPA